MKMLYEKPTISVEQFSLTQSIAGCTGIKICGKGSSQDVINDPNSTEQMVDFANAFGFIRAGGCLRPMDGYVEAGGTDGDSVCYHGPIISAFPS